MFTNIIDWFFDEANGGVRRFYVLIGVTVVVLFIYTNVFKLNDYAKVDAERLRLNTELQTHIAEEARLKTELEFMKQQVNIALEQLEKNKKVDEKEKQVIANMSMRDKLAYLASAGNIDSIRSQEGSVSDSATTR